jgi:hypothetical protein
LFDGVEFALSTQEAKMAQYQFHEMGDFFVNTHAVEKQEGLWAAFVFFERKADASKTLSPGMRHHIRHDYGSEAEALQAAAAYAAQTILQGETGL